MDFVKYFLLGISILPVFLGTANKIYDLKNGEKNSKNWCALLSYSIGYAYCIYICFILIGSILYCVAGALMFLYIIFVIPSVILGFVGYYQVKTKKKNSTKAEGLSF